MRNIEEAIKYYGLKGVHPAAEIPPMMSDDEFAELVEDVKKKGFLHPARVTKEGFLIDGRNRLCASIEAGKDVRIEEFNPSDPLGYVISENKRRNLSLSQRAAMGVDIEAYLAVEAKQRQVEAGGWHGNQYEKVAVVENLPQVPNRSEEKKHLPKCQNCHKEFEPYDVCGETERQTCKFCRSDILIAKEKARLKSRDQAAAMVGVSGKMVSDAKKIHNEAPDLSKQIKSGEKTVNAAKKELKERQILEPKPASKPTFNETNDNIEWAPYSWNPVTGCKMGCPYCYARDIGMRFNKTFEPQFHPERLEAPKNTKVKLNKPNNVFVCSMADLFGDWVPVDWIEAVIANVAINPQWNFLFLTKNPKRYLEFEFPENCWLGATADNQGRANNALDAFGQMYGHVRFLSCEPLMGPVDLGEDPPVDWIIIGGRSKSSGMEAGQPEWKWVLNLLKYDDIPVYFKPNLTVRPKEMPNV